MYTSLDIVAQKERVLTKVQPIRFDIALVQVLILPHLHRNYDILLEHERSSAYISNIEDHLTL
jgi:hypothetical protein